VVPENADFEGDSVIKIRNVAGAATIIDGQHRLKGFEGYTGLFELPVTIFLDMEMEDQARLFSIINTKQTRINPSLARDLEAFSTIETPEKIAHSIARASNSEPSNPWYGRLKMLGVKDDLTGGILTQHAFVTEIIGLTYPAQKFQNDVHSLLKANHNKRKPLDKEVQVDRTRYPLWAFYLEGKDDVAKKILDNYFDAVRSAFPEEWGNPERILTKTIGYIALMKHLRTLIPQGVSEKSLSKEFFGKNLQRAKARVGPIQLSVQEFGSSAVGAEKLRQTMFGDE
jgi:DGQHR domain-containing protein